MNTEAKKHDDRCERNSEACGCALRAKAALTEEQAGAISYACSVLEGLVGAAESDAASRMKRRIAILRELAPIAVERK